MSYLLCPEEALAPAQQLMRDLSSTYAAFRLGSHTSPSEGIITYPGAGGEGGSWRRGLREAAEQLQRRLLLQPPPIKCALPAVYLTIC